MKILQVTPGYYPELGGVERHIQEISEALAENGHEVVVATAARDVDLPPHEKVAGVTVRRFHALGRYPYLFPVGMFGYLREQARHFDIVHAHNYHALALLAAALACPRRTVMSPYYHGHGHARLTDALHRIYDPFAMTAVRRMSGTICLSASEANLVAQHFQIDRAKIAVIPSITNVVGTAFERYVGQTSPAPARGRLILSVGRLDSYKRIDRLIGALPDLPAAFELAVIGSGPERERLEQLASHLGVRNRVHFLGRVSDAELQAWYQRADIAVSLSTSESFGRVVVEALAAGRRVVCSDIPAFRDFAAEFPQVVTLAPNTHGAHDLAALIESAVYRPRARISLQRYTRQTILDNLELAYSIAATSAMRLYSTASLQEPTIHENSARV